MVKALIAAAHDSSEQVRADITDSLRDVSRKQPELVLSSCIQFIKTEGKSKRPHVIQLLVLIIEILENDLYNISEQLSIYLIRMALAEMVKDKNVIPEWQGPACKILVIIGKRFPQPVWSVLIDLFPPGSIPHYFVLKTMGDISAANPTEIVPNLKEVMARALPVLGQIKKDNMRWVFASCFGNWCEAIQIYLANMDSAPDKSISQETFSSEVFPAYEVMFNSWMGSRESKVRLATIHAVGQMCAVMPLEQLSDQIVRIVPAFLKMYSKEKLHLPITQGLSTILGVCVKNSVSTLEPLLIPVLNVLHPLTCAAAGTSTSSNPAVAKNTNELLRCFEIIGIGYSEQLCSYLLARLDITKVKSASIRGGTLGILKHLITRLGSQLEDKKELILSGVRPLIDNETSLEVRKVLCQVIIAMASEQYLLLEGGHRMIEFIIKQCSISEKEIEIFNQKAAKSKSAPDLTPERLRTMCDNVLHLATTTVDDMDSILWPFLFEFLVSPKYTEALHVICRCLAHVAAKKRQSNAPDYMIDFDIEVNIPKPTEIIVRLFVMLNEPLRRGQLGIRILQCLQAIGPVLNPLVSDMWDNAMPKLAHYINENADSESWDSSTWEDLTLRLLSETIKLVGDEEWTQVLGDKLCEQLEFYKGQPNMKKCALKHTGLILQRISRREYIKDKLDFIFNTIDHSDPLERQGCAQAYGFCSASQLDIVLDKIKSLAEAGSKKSGGFFSFGSSKADTKNKNTIFLCLGYVAAYASPKLVVARLDSHIIHTLEPYTQQKQLGNQAKENIIRSIDLIAKALHPSHLQEEFTFRRRDDMISLLIAFMSGGAKSAEVSPDVRILGLNTCSTLIHLKPAMSPELEAKLISSTMKFYFSPPPPPSKQPKSAQDHQENIRQIEQNFHEMIGSILYMDTTTLCFGRIFDILSPFLVSEKASQRKNVISACIALLKRFIEFKSAEEGETSYEESFAAIGRCVGLFVPRFTDPEPEIRMGAIECLELVFFIDHMLRTSVGQESYNFEPPEELAESPELRGRIQDADIHEQFLIVHQLSTIAARLLPSDELSSFLVHCFDGLTDPHASSSSGTCVMINTTLKMRGEELGNEVESLVGGMLKAMEATKVEKTLNGTLHSLRTLAIHHLLPVVEELLKSPIPHSQNVVKSLQAIAKDPNLVTQVTDHLTDIINNSQILEEKGSDKKMLYEHVPRACSATTALGEIFELEEMEEVARENFSQIFCSLLLRFGTSRYGKTPAAADQCLKTFEQFVSCTKHEQLQEIIDDKDNTKQLASNTDYHYVLTKFVKAVCVNQPDEMPTIYQFILPYLQGNFTGQRIVTATVFAEMISHVKNDRELLQSLINNELTIIVDEKLKLMAIRGLGNIADAGAEEVNRFSSTVIDALMCAIDSKDEELAMEAMNGLSRVFELVDEKCVAPVLVNICHRVRPAFEKDQDEIRCASFQLFATLHRFGNDVGAQIFYEQIHNNFTTLFLHVNDPNEDVRKACKLALKNFAPLLQAEKLVDFFNEVLHEDRELNYDAFLNQLSVHLIEYFPERLNLYVMTSIEYFKSDWIPLREGAATFIGHALGNVPEDKKFSVGLNPGIISSALIGLLKQKSPKVRSAGAIAMSRLYSY
eukprot:CAMPEP_0206186026 /NCGR_PEP_ID=MMETSP0166-20121206/2167_1 /ASSEMBLY_ACC=CAM_ASM_000260 /TAXON_ID=95228 /ORGANISM="Vannella robusta, Strain DIVA3 518/3/11/1/6" /LENGTH=1620 /DNA_ID=CAMNT_0053601351 /DNA_START=1 /DNA_END=4863 /DNA_ORIENTATION=-